MSNAKKTWKDLIEIIGTRKKHGEEIALNINDTITSDPKLNSFFTSVADNIRKTSFIKKKGFGSFLKNKAFFFYTN